MDYFFILGNHPLLSEAEIKAVLPASYNPRFFSDKALVLSLDQELDTVKFLSFIGGTIKVGKILSSFTRLNEASDKALEALKNYLPASGKFSFGISSYGHKGPQAKSVGMLIKNKLRDQGVSCRWVTSREADLSSVVVEQNKLLSNSGKELVFLTADKKTLLGITLAVQPFKNLSARDYGRPNRDDYSGMLPPKLAQIMINLSGAKRDDLLIDPFCGSGTILTEAMFMGFKNIKGGDISTKAINDSEANIIWTAKKYGLKNQPQLKKADAKELAKFYKPNSIGAIVSEVYLGPQRGKFDLTKMINDLNKMYSDFLLASAPLIKKSGRIVLALPAFLQGKKTLTLKIPASLIKKDSFLYGRNDQRVFREILVLEKTPSPTLPHPALRAREG